MNDAWYIIMVINEWKLQIPHLRPAEYNRSRLHRNRRTVNRAYGGVLSGSAVRERFVFLNFLSLLCLIFIVQISGVPCLLLSLVLLESFELSWLKSKRLWKRSWRSKRQRKNKLWRAEFWERVIKIFLEGF